MDGKEGLVTALVTVALAIIALATFATAVSPNARTGQVIQAGTGGLATDIQAATAPVTGGGLGGLPSLSMPGGSFGNGIG